MQVLNTLGTVLSPKLTASFGDSGLTISCLQAMLRGINARDPLVGLLYATVDAVHREWQFVNAGFEPGLLIRRCGVMDRLERSGPSLGLSGHAAWRAATTTFTGIPAGVVGVVQITVQVLSSITTRDPRWP